MEMQSYASSVRAQLTAAAALGDESTRAVAEALATAAEPAVRLALLEAVSAAADEITAALLDAPGAPAVGVRLDHDDLRIDVRLSEPAEPVAMPAPLTADDGGENSARISLRLPEAVKEEIEGAARRDSVSVNTWLLRAAGAALSRSVTAGVRHSGAGRITGWING